MLGITLFFLSSCEKTEPLSVQGESSYKASAPKRSKELTCPPPSFGMSNPLAQATADGCQTSACPGILYVTIDDISCPPGVDCFLTLYKNKANAEGLPIVGEKIYPCVCETCDIGSGFQWIDMPLCDETTYEFKVDLNGPAAAGSNIPLSHRYVLTSHGISGVQGSQTSIDVTLSGAVSETYTFGPGSSASIALFPTGACN